MIKEHLDKENLHHAYLIEGDRAEVVPEILKFLKSLGIKTSGNADMQEVEVDALTIADARNLKSYATERGISPVKKIFIITANNILLEAQNSLLKMFEEPIANTHFFVVVPDASALLKTLLSRFYFISSNRSLETGDAEKFITMPFGARVNFIKELLVEPEEEDEEGNEILILDSTRSKALKFLNALESVLHAKFLKNSSGLTQPLYQIFKVRKFLRMPGSSPKTLLESVALLVPNF